MKKMIFVVSLLCLATSVVSAKGGHGSSGSSHAVSGHVRSNGTYVAPSRATNPNGMKADNYSTKGNVNPYTGKEGTK